MLGSLLKVNGGLPRHQTADKEGKGGFPFFVVISRESMN
jgi:hypothetical protein